MNTPQRTPEEIAEEAGLASNEQFAQSVHEAVSAQRAADRVAGCSRPTLVIIGAVILVLLVVVAWILGNAGTHGTPGSAPPTSSAPLAGLDGDWVLVSGLRNPLTDMPFACSGCDAAGNTVTLDDPAAYIDISGTEITGGEYKTGFTVTVAGDTCPIEQQARIDASVSGGVDPNAGYGTLVIDGTPTAFFGCDANFQPIPQTGAELGHFSRLFYVRNDTLYLCQGLNAFFDGCTGPNGGPADPLATFQR